MDRSIRENLTKYISIIKPNDASDNGSFSYKDKSSHITSHIVLDNLDVLNFISLEIFGLDKEMVIQRNVAAQLQAILNTLFIIDNTSLKDILLRNEIILSNIRSLDEGKNNIFGSISLRDLYPGAFFGKEVPSIKINAAMSLQYVNVVLVDFPNENNFAMLPRFTQTKGLDALIHYRGTDKKSTSSFIFHQHKFSFE